MKFTDSEVAGRDSSMRLQLYETFPAIADSRMGR